ncbi:hypothetical protein [Metallumcola ferriviriculae]
MFFNNNIKDLVVRKDRNIRWVLENILGIEYHVSGNRFYKL